MKRNINETTRIRGKERGGTKILKLIHRTSNSVGSPKGCGSRGI